ncbi:probable NADH dehydrogenase [ubiquinone] 1 alpha subcomplex subunit 12 isoform X2 [Pseudomyrmex gracilis]|uniref:probable NADH dehydrogenase [ubiquinone] 1 alpha subcomplex subunit 12 isoform X2 n=1 Tax=Pseudomyrmex gracilis TaxID=219809 RepID=UPI000995B404|nr:probable NADH dehydrogenase [ubiquinone] 1 alpha subcomplex subunit 12 isoform X2 [Pseudomyrmex gracilis]
MAKLLGLDKLVTVFRIIRENGGIINSIKTFYRTDDLRTGTLVGVDKFGNRYFENNTFFVGRNRWVNYSEKVGLNYDGSQVPAEWFVLQNRKLSLGSHHSDRCYINSSKIKAV